MSNGRQQRRSWFGLAALPRSDGRPDHEFDAAKPDAQAGFGRASLPELPRWLLVFGALIFVAIAAVYAFSLTFSQFALYDDQGLLMISVRGYLEGHPLYDGIFSLYGPIYYFYAWFVHGLISVPLTHDATRALCVLHWLVAAAILSVAGGILTRSPLLALFIFAQGMAHLRTLSNEPGHPQELVVLLLAFAVLVIAGGLKRPRSLVLLGAISAALAFTKINVGAFFGIALFQACVCYTPLFRRRLLCWVMLALGGLLPFLLMRQDLGQDWARLYAALACAAIVAAGVVVYSLAEGRSLGLAQWGQIGLGYLGLSVLVLAVLLLTGTSLMAMVNNLVVSPSKMAGYFCIPLNIPSGYWSAAAALPVAVVVVAWRRHLTRLSLATASAKGLYGVVGTLVLVLNPRHQMGYLLPWLWLLMLPSGKNQASRSGDAFPRAILCLLAAWQALQGYPVAGSQVATGTFLFIPVCSLCLHDAILTFMRERRTARHLLRFSPRSGLLLRALAFAALFCLFAAQWCPSLPEWRYYASLPPLDLPGAHYLHLPAYQADSYRELAHYVERESDTFITSPGLNSLYFWTRKTPPTSFNISGETILSDYHQQARIVAALRRARHPLIVINDGRVVINARKARSLESVGLLGNGPLVEFVDGAFVEIKRFGCFRILAPKSVIPGTASAETSRVN